MNVKFLIALGLLGLLGIVALLLIYIIKPNFQQKLISSTYIWKLSLKFKKRKITIKKNLHPPYMAYRALPQNHTADLPVFDNHTLNNDVPIPGIRPFCQRTADPEMAGKNWL